MNGYEGSEQPALERCVSSKYTIMLLLWTKADNNGVELFTQATSKFLHDGAYYVLLIRKISGNLI